LLFKKAEPSRKILKGKNLYLCEMINNKVRKYVKKTKYTINILLILYKDPKYSTFAQYVQRERIEN
ncbi:MAG TPA: hypothetical protein VN040_07725, partial [Pseudosphingobacterium sp.]|nr:hypothetical protein [Pseudosphingobacterium sp.]